MDYGYYGPGSATWKIASEAAISLGGTRAVLMQIAHPLVAAGVFEHSRYMTDPFGRAEHTFVLGQMITFGSTTTTHDAARTINRLHKHVHGTLTDRAGAYRNGTPYTARDPELLLWVHATLIDTILYTYPLLIGPLNQQEQEQYYQESKTLASLRALIRTSDCQRNATKPRACAPLLVTKQRKKRRVRSWSQPWGYPKRT